MRFLQAVYAILALALLGGATTVLADGRGGHTSYIGSNADSPVQVPDAAALWSMAMDKLAGDYLMSGGVAATDGERVFFLQNGKLTAVQASTGKMLWTTGSKLKAPLLVDGGQIFALSEDGRAVAAETKTGRKLWAAKASVQDARKLYASQGQLYVQGADVTAFRISDGAYLWKQGEFHGELMFHDGYMLATQFVSGAYGYDVLHAYDCKTGKQAWELQNEGLPIDARGQILLSERQQTIFDHVLLTTLIRSI